MIALISLIKQCVAVFIELMETFNEDVRNGAPNKKPHPEFFNFIELKQVKLLIRAIHPSKEFDML